jgi:hypothetical protein
MAGRRDRQPRTGASRHNLGEAKALGVRDVAFHKKAGLRIKDMVRSNWVYRKLRNFRAGIESDISCLKRAYGLARYIWRGLDHFRAYVVGRRLQPCPLRPPQAGLTFLAREPLATRIDIVPAFRSCGQTDLGADQTDPAIAKPLIRRRKPRITPDAAAQFK